MTFRDCLAILSYLRTDSDDEDKYAEEIADVGDETGLHGYRR